MSFMTYMLYNHYLDLGFRDSPISDCIDLHSEPNNLTVKLDMELNFNSKS